MSKAPSFPEAVAAASDALEKYLVDSERGLGPAIGYRPLPEVREALRADALLNLGLTAESLPPFIDTILQHSTRLHHPGYMAHQVASPLPAGAIGDLIHGTINNPMAVYEMGPAMTALETVVLEWMLAKVGWDPAVSGGVLTHGGSLANLTALLAARGRIAPEAWTSGMPDDLVLIAPGVSHYSINRAAGIMGLGTNRVWSLDTDSLERVVPDSVETLLLRAENEGKRVIAVVVNAGATSTGLFDPIAEVASLCREHNTWLHVDACHGGSFLISRRHRHLLTGVDRADSVVWDAHKMMRTSSLAAAVLFKDVHAFADAFHQKASYLFYERNEMGFDYIARTVECTKGALGLKVYLVLAMLGEQGLEEYIDGRIEITQLARERILSRNGFECPYQPESNILCFRAPGTDDDQVRIREQLMHQGDFHITSTTVHDRRYLRLTIMAEATTGATIDALLDAIEALC